MSNEIQEIFLDPVRVQRALKEGRPTAALEQLKQGFFEWQYDSIVYSIRVGETQLKPKDVARQAVRASVAWLGPISTSPPFPTIRVLRDLATGVIDPMLCTLPGCGFKAESFVELGRHISGHGSKLAEADFQSRDEPLEEELPRASTDDAPDDSA